MTRKNICMPNVLQIPLVQCECQSVLLLGCFKSMYIIWMPHKVLKSISSTYFLVYKQKKFLPTIDSISLNFFHQSASLLILSTGYLLVLWLSLHFSGGGFIIFIHLKMHFLTYHIISPFQFLPLFMYLPFFKNLPPYLKMISTFHHDFL